MLRTGFFALPETVVPALCPGFESMRSHGRPFLSERTGPRDRVSASRVRSL